MLIGGWINHFNIQEYKIPNLSFLAKFDQRRLNLNGTSQKVDHTSNCLIDINLYPSQRS